MPVDVLVLPGEVKVVQTNVKAYMQPDEVLELKMRSSAAIKRGLQLATGTSAIDMSYYENQENDGNISLPLYNRTGRAITIKAGERVVQGIFYKYLVADEDDVMKDKRTGGSGSTDQ